MLPRPSARLDTLIVLAAYAAAAAVGIWADALVGFDPGQLPVVFVGAAYVVAGAVIVTRADGNRVGWLLMVFGLSLVTTLSVSQYATLAYVTRPEAHLPLASLAAWLELWSWLVALAALAVVVFLFPDGHLPSPRWRAPFVGVLAILAAVFLAFAFGQSADANMPAIRNPFYVEALAAPYRVIQDAFFLYLIVFGTGVASLVTRARGARADERQQLKWIAAAAAFMFAGFAVAHALSDVSFIGDVAWMATYSALPIAITVSILRYRLYAIDVLIERTVVYAALTALLGATYVAAVIATEAVLGRFTGGNELAVAASTLLVVALFQPVRRGIQNAVDLRFYRARYDAERTLDAFAARLRDSVDLDALEHDLLGVVDGTFRPATASVWLRDRPS